MPCNYVIRSEVIATDGRRGHGFTWLPQIGPRAAYRLIVDDCRDLVRGGTTDPTVVWDRLWSHLHEAGPGGLTTIAMAAIDTALWDLELSTRDTSLPERLGPRRHEVAAYGSGVNYHYSLDELAAQVERWVDAGFAAVKIKVGHPDLDDDVERVATTREIIGPDRLLMVDANQRWDLAAAVAAVRRLTAFDLAWVEEPLLADDVAGYETLASVTDVPIAVGENHYTTYQYEDLLRRGACAVMQPNVARVGGITPFLRIARMAAAAGIQVHPHHLPEISAQLALCLAAPPAQCLAGPPAQGLAGPPMVEVVEDASFEALGLLASPGGAVRDGAVYRLAPGSGLGMDLDMVGCEQLEP